MKTFLFIMDLPAPPLLIVLCLLIFLGTAYASYKN